ncbi:MAG: hypothetical protein K0U98_04020 [Deltaproteobacteria bacterium]|nr:hypothetical protein [Deltaproteobacteria bacterium]
MKAPALARWDDKLRPWLVRLPGRLPIRLYSAGRPFFLDRLVGEPPPSRRPPESLRRVLWGLPFGFPLGNAAGMFKNGEGYALAAAQGAGFYLAGTTTAQPRQGNHKHGISRPFAPYPRTHGASNWLGLPNHGHRRVAERLSQLEKVEGCPVGASLTADPEGTEEERLEGLVEGMKLYAEAGVDFLEINESCPNTEQGASAEGELFRRLDTVRRRFLEHRDRTLPVVVKFSNDTAIDQLPALMDMLLSLEFDGVNFGNTSTRYDHWRSSIDRSDRPLFDSFRRSFGGGFSGRPLKAVSLGLAERAAHYCQERSTGTEFHVLRTGGVETLEDLTSSQQAGVALNGWFTGYFEAFAQHGHDLYEVLWQ